MNYTNYTKPVSDEEALKETCVLCGAVPDEPCVYVKLPQTHSRSTYSIARQNKTGQPTKRPHNHRYNVVRMKRSGGPVKDRTSARYQSIRKATQEFERREYMAMKEWLINYGSILWS